jgi:hypothetical protein
MASSQTPLSIKNIADHFGDATPPFNLGKYYRGASVVPSNATSTIPLSGPIRVAHFRGTVPRGGSLFRRKFTAPLNTSLTTTALMNSAFNNATVNELMYVTDFNLPNEDTFCVEFTGWFKPTVVGVYSFSLRSNDASDVALHTGTGWQIITWSYGNKAMPSELNAQTFTVGTGNGNFMVNTLIPIRIRFHEDANDQGMFFEWLQPGGTAWALVPFTVLSAPDFSTALTYANTTAFLPNPRVA